MHPRTLVPLLALLCLLLVACGETAGSSDSSTETSSEAAGEEDAPTGTETGGTQDDDQADPGSGAAVTDDMHGVAVEGDLDSKPEITLPGGEPPSELVVVDLEQGDGAEATAGAQVTTHYVGVSWLNDGAEFDASWGGEPATFPLAGVIQGWQEGIPGMRVGGRRMLIIPPDMAYGSQPPPGAPIAPDDTLVFVIDLVDVG